jgi:hypothetical protein
MFTLESVLTRIQKAKEPEENAKEAEESVKPDWQGGLPIHVVQNTLGERAARIMFKQSSF